MKQSDGYIALLSVLIVGAAAMAIAVALLVTGSDAQRSNLVMQQSIQARQLAHGCVDEALQKIHDSSSFVGSGTVTLDTGSCTYTVTNTGGSNRTITTNSTIGNVVRKVTTYVTIGASSISITSWQEVS
jgi:hypothetical protein